MGAAVILAVVGGRQVCGEAASRDLAKARGAKLRDLLRSVEGTDREPPRTFRTPDGYVRFLSAGPATHFVIAAGTAEQQAKAFLGRWRNIFVNESPAVALEQKRVKTANGRSYIRYRQTYRGIEVFGAEMIIQVGNASGVEAVISDIMRDTVTLDAGTLSINPAIDASTAQRKAIEFMAAQYGNLQFEATPPTLMIYSPVVVGNSGPPKLVWRTEVGNLGDLVARELILVDAHSGEIAFHYSLICGNMTRQVTDAYISKTYYDSNCCPTGGDVEVDLAFKYLEDTYWFYLDHHGRENWNDSPDTDLYAHVRVSWLSWPSQWGGGTIYVQAGSVTDDTFGHEFTHGVIQTDSQLGGSGEAGAIQESLCDMWGEWIYLENGKDRDDNDDDPDHKWYLWEDDLNYETISDKRYMKDPPEFGWTPPDKGRWYVDPDRYNHPDFYDGSYDDGGEHHNCGVGNKLAYLLYDGTSGEDNGEFNGETITGLGMPNENELDTSDLYYECQCYLLTSSADYHDLAYALILAARNLGFTAEEQEDVVRACRAVEIYSGNTAFSIQDSAGARVAWFDDLGNLYLAGRAFQNGEEVAIEAHWKLDETTGSTAYDSVGSNHGALTGCQWTNDAERGWSLDFDGGDDKVTLSAINALTGNNVNVTVSAWINADNPSATYSPILRQYDSNWNGYDLCIVNRDNIIAQPSFYLDEHVVRGDTINADDWYHLVGTYDGDHLRIYVDGKMSEGDFPGNNGTNTAAYVGWGVDLGPVNCYFDGTIDDVRVYNYALSYKEVRYLPSLDPDDVVVRIENSSDESVARFDDLGYLFLDGDVEQGVTDMDPLEGNDQFVITDGSGDPVAYIDDSGNLYLAGKLYDEEEQTE